VEFFFLRVGEITVPDNCFWGALPTAALDQGTGRGAGAGGASSRFHKTGDTRLALNCIPISGLRSRRRYSPRHEMENQEGRAEG
jgi:hypothetical protein